MQGSTSKLRETDIALQELRMQLRLIDEAILLLERLEHFRKAGGDGQQPDSNPSLSFQFGHHVRLPQHQS